MAKEIDHSFQKSRLSGVDEANFTWWSNFLAPLSDKTYARAPVNPDFPRRTDTSYALYKSFISRLKKNELETDWSKVKRLGRIFHIKTQAEQAFYKLSSVESEIEAFDDDFLKDLLKGEKFDEIEHRVEDNILKIKMKSLHLLDKCNSMEQTTNKKKAARQISASQWDVERLAEFIKEEDTILFDGYSSRSSQTEVNRYSLEDNIKKRLGRLSEITVPKSMQFFSDQLTLQKFTGLDGNETDVRQFLDVIFQELCHALGLTIKLEKTLKSDQSFCNAQNDYAFYFRGACIGIVEAKSPGKLEPDSMAQLIVGMIKAQTYNQSGDISIVGILTDGYKYILVCLSDDKLIFEAEQTELDLLKVHKADTWKELFVIVNLLADHFEFADSDPDFATWLRTRREHFDKLASENRDCATRYYFT